MPMLIAYRRRMGVVVLAILAALLLGNLVPDPLGAGIWRGGPKPDAGFFARMHGNLRSLGFYFKDNFGFRASMPVVRRELRALIGSPDTSVMYAGPRGQLFWSLQRAPEQSAGQIYRVAAVERFVALVEAMRRKLPQTRIVVALPPNAQTVDVNDLPNWFRWVPPRPTEYSLVLADLKQAGVDAVDLREVLGRAPGDRKYLPNDTHWTNLSATVAFNAVMVAAGHPEWQVDINAAVGPMAPVDPGDLARSANMKTVLPDENNVMRFDPAWVRQPHPALTSQHQLRGFWPYVMRFRPSGPRVMILGDSYTADIWPYLFGFTPVAEVAWMHFSRTAFGSCDFDFGDVERFAPDVLIVARTERLFPCLNQEWPTHLPMPASEAGRK